MMMMRRRRRRRRKNNRRKQNSAKKIENIKEREGREEKFYYEEAEPIINSSKICLLIKTCGWKKIKKYFPIPIQKYRHGDSKARKE